VRADEEPSEGWHHIGLSLAGGGHTAVTVGPGCSRGVGTLWQPRWRTAAIVADQTVERLYAEAVEHALEPVAGRVVRCSFPAGEASKSRETKARIEDELLGAGLGRDGCIVAVGGGVTLDLAGFVAATYLRGIDTIYLPTTLLGQVDAALGGKTGVNTPAGKNLVGAFHHPRVVLVDPNYLATLPPIGDEALLDWVEARAPALRAGPPIDPEPIARCLRLKARVVEADEREGGPRRVLNFGHTIGHAIEAASGWRWGHGHAIAVGMRVEAQLAERLVGLPRQDAERIEALLGALGLPARAGEIDFDALVPYLQRDKKRGHALRAALPEALGRMARAGGKWAVDASLAELRDAWRAVMAGSGP
jgi:3-dehydroquinate synthase